MATQTFVHTLSHLMPWAMTGWLLLGAGAIIRNRYTVAKDADELEAVKAFVKDARGSDYEGRLGIRLDVFKWAEAHKSSAIARWIFTAHNAARAGGVPDAAALTDAIWSHERERYQWLRFFGRNAILMGLLFTSVGLCATLMDIHPALTAHGLTEAEWLNGVRNAMANALVGMATAFYSSLFGIAITLILQVLNLLAFARVHENHVINLDAFVQGSLIPTFSAIAEKDRNDVIVLAMNKAEDMFTKSCEQFAESRNQYDRLYERTAAHAADMAVVRDTLSESLLAFSTQVNALSDQVGLLDAVADKLMQSADTMGDAIKGGMKQIESTQGYIVSQFELQKQTNDRVLHALDQTIGNLQAQTQAAQDNAGELVEVRTSLRAQADELQSLVSTHQELGRIWGTLNQSLSINEDQLRAELETRRNALEAMMDKMGGEVSQGLAGPVRGVLEAYLRQLNQLLDKRTEETHLAQVSFNQSMDKKWDQLLNAVGAYRDARV